MKKLLEKLMTVDGMVLLDVKTAKGVYGGSIEYDSSTDSDQSTAYDTSDTNDSSEHHDS